MGSSQYLYNAKMREEIVEQLGVTPTPGGLQKLLEQHETDRLNAYHEAMESFGGDVGPLMFEPPALKDVFFDPEDDSLGSLYNESIENLEGAGVGSILPTKYNPAAQGVAGINALISKIMMGGSMDKFNELGDPEDVNFSPTGMNSGGIVHLAGGGNARAVSIVPKVSNTTIPMSHWRPSTSTGRISVNIGSQGPAIVKTIDPGSVAGSQSVGEALRRFVKTGLGRGNTSTSTTPKKGSVADRYKWNPYTGSNLSGSDNVRFSAMFNLGGSRGFGRGAGGNFGEGQRMERRERRIMKNMPIEQRLELESRGFGRGAQAARERVAANPSAGLSKPSNYDELAAYYIKHGGFDENAPVTQWGDG